MEHACAAVWKWLSGLDYEQVVPTWITALTTAGALVAAMYAARATWHALGLQRDVVADQRSDAERAHQADSVAVWHTFMQSAIVYNSSALPIYDVVVEFYGPDGLLRGTAWVDKPIPAGDWSVFWPQGMFAEHERDEEGNIVRITEQESPDGFTASITFRDTRGRYWHRGNHGLLSKAERRVRSSDAKPAGMRRAK